MKELIIHGSNKESRILVGESIKNLSKYLLSEKVIVITDTNVNRLYNKEFNQVPIIEIGTGEQIKTLQTVQFIYEKLMEYEADRTSFIIGIGGGIVCDITGFVASTYMRGVRFGFVATTLLAQVDASLGGKNGVNLNKFKNMIGVFNQPDFVLCDMNLLKTLPDREILCGMGEIVKHTLIAYSAMFNYLEENYQKAITLDNQVIEKLVYESVVIKSDVVNKDEKEKGLRRILNFGHTIGHAIEKCSSDITHGEAISIGMVMASAISVNKKLLKKDEYLKIIDLLKKLKLPVSTTIDKQKIIDAMKKDKKREGASINFILLDGIGKTLIESIKVNELEKIINL